MKSVFNFSSKNFVSGLAETEFAPKNCDKKHLNNLPVRILKPKGPLFFGNIESMIKSYSLADDHEILIVDLSNVSMVDLTGAYALEDLIKNSMKKNIEVFISGIDLRVEKTLQKLNFIENIGLNNFNNSKISILPILKKRYNLSFDFKA